MPYSDQPLLDLLWRFLRQTLYDDGLYRDVSRGISRGCALSPLLGALYLKPLDDRLAGTELFYARFMDDWVILAPTRWKLRAAIKQVNDTLAALNIEKHPDKTFIGRISHGFDFLGYQFSPAGLDIAPKTIERCSARIARLYEQGADPSRIGTYVHHWWRWLRAGVTLSPTVLAAWQPLPEVLVPLGPETVACSIQTRMSTIVSRILPWDQPR